MIPFVAENTVNNTVHSTVEKEVNDTVESSAIYKQNKNNKKKDTNVSKEKMVSAANNRFIPPTLEEVQAYCQERGNKVDAEQFVNFYSAKGWYVGKNKMKDWKAVISKRFDKLRKKQIRKRNTDQKVGSSNLLAHAIRKPLKLVPIFYLVQAVFCRPAI